MAATVWARVDEQDDDIYSSCDTASKHSASVYEDLQDSQETEDQEDDGSDVDPEAGYARGPHTGSEKQRVQFEVMKAYAANLSAIITKKEIEDAVMKMKKEGQFSIRDILAHQETNVRITNPRDYQTELYQRAKTENIVAVLDTGSGKTHIATLLLGHVLEQELEHRAKGGVHRIAFFLVRM